MAKKDPKKTADELLETTETQEPESEEVEPMTDDADEDAPVAIVAAVPEPANLHDRLTKAVRALAPDAGQEAAHALNQLELLTGRLKMVIPAGIAATEDSDIKTHLESLLSLL